MVVNSIGDDQNSVNVTIVSGPIFTCHIQGTAVGTYQEVSFIVIYEFNEDHCTSVCQFEMRCVDGKQWDSVTYSLSAPGEDYATIGLRFKCSSRIMLNYVNAHSFQPVTLLVTLV